MYIIKKEIIREICENLFDMEDKELRNQKGGARKVSSDGLYIKFIPVPDNEEWVIGMNNGEDITGGLSIQIPSTPSPPEGAAFVTFRW